MELSKKHILMILLLTVFVFSNLLLLTIERYLITIEGFAECARVSYEDFGKEIAKLDQQMKPLLKNKALTGPLHSGDYLDRNVNSLFSLTRFNLEKIKNRYTTGDITFFYSDLTQLLNDISADRQVSEAEQRFLKDLSAYTSEVIKLHDHYSEKITLLDFNSSFIKKFTYSNQVIDMYYGFFKDTDMLINSERYAYMRDFQGDYSTFDYASAEKICHEVYAQLIGGKPLTYNNKKEIYKRDLVFQTMPLDQDLFSPEAFNKTDHDYFVRFSKDYSGIFISINSYNDSGEVLSPSVLGQKAEVLANKISTKAKRLETHLDDAYANPDKSTFKYTFLVNPKGQTDEERNMNIELLKSGEVLSIWLPILP